MNVQAILDTVPTTAVAEAVIWGFRVVVITFAGIIAWFLKRTAEHLDRCHASISEVRMTTLPAHDKRIALMEQRMDEAEKEIDQLQLRDITRSNN